MCVVDNAADGFEVGRCPHSHTRKYYPHIVSTTTLHTAITLLMVSAYIDTETMIQLDVAKAPKPSSK